MLYYQRSELYSKVSQRLATAMGMVLRLELTPVGSMDVKWQVFLINMRKEYEIEKLNPRKNPYAKSLKRNATISMRERKRQLVLTTKNCSISN